MKRITTKNNCELVIVSYNLTNKFQPLDITVNQAVKKLISNRINTWYVDKVNKQLSSKIAPNDVKVSLKLGQFNNFSGQVGCRHVQPSQETKRFHNQRF